jgi:hypothetical protein
MLHDVNSMAAKRPIRSREKSGTSLREKCLLCSVLWPMIVQHRHLLLEDSTEAKTLFPAPNRAR